MPLLAEGQAAVFYPLNLLFLFLPPPIANNLLTFLQFVIGALGIALLFKTLKIGFTGGLLGSITYLFNMYFICNINHINIIIVMTLAPFILTFIIQALQLRKYRGFLLSGLFLALSLLGGIHPSNSYTILAVFLILLFNPIKREQYGDRPSSVLFPIYGFILLLLTALTLSAVQLLPSTELTRLSVRAAASGYHQATQYSWEPHFFLTILFPFIWGNPADQTLATTDFFWEFYAYTGIITFFVIIPLFKHRRDRMVVFFTILASLSLLLALGKHSPLFFLFKLPIAGLFRAPARFLFLYVLSISVLSGIGLDDMIRRKRKGDAKGNLFSVFALGSFLLLCAVILHLNRPLFLNLFTKILENHDQFFLKFAGEITTPEDISHFCIVESKNILSALIRFFVLLGFIALLPVFSRRKKIASYCSALILIQFLDLYSAGAKLNPTTKREFFNQKNWAVEQISKLDSDGRVVSVHTPHREMSFHDGYPRAVLTEDYNRAVYQDLGRNLPALLRIHALTGDSPLILRNYHRFLYAALGSEADPLNSYITWRDINNFYRFSLNRRDLSALLQRNNNLLSLANATYLVTKEGISEQNWTSVIESGPNGLKLYRNSRALPRARFVQKAVHVNSPDDALMRYLQGVINPWMETAIAGDTSLCITEQQASPSNDDSTLIDWEKEDALEIKLKIQTPNPGYLVLADNYYPGWKATVDGIQTKILNADVCFRAVRVPAGRHAIQFHYEPASFRWGAYISICSALLLILSQIGSLMKRIRR